VKELWKLAVEVGTGLRDLHAANVVHRDLKPTNIYMTSSGHFKIGFFTVHIPFISSFSLDVRRSGGIETEGGDACVSDLRSWNPVSPLLILHGSCSSPPCL
jgi:serine/threonine protein kinase